MLTKLLIFIQHDKVFTKIGLYKSIAGYTTDESRTYRRKESAETYQSIITSADIYIRMILNTYLLQIKFVTSQHERSLDSQIHPTIYHYRRRNDFTDKKHQHISSGTLPVACYRQGICTLDEKENGQQFYN